MGRALKISLTAEQKAELESGYRKGEGHSFRLRCRMVLLKDTGMKSKTICETVGVASQQQVNKWIKKYKLLYPEMGLAVLKNQKGQGRKPVLDIGRDAQAVKKAVQAERQRLSEAKSILEKEMGKEFSLRTLGRFLKNLAHDSSASVDG